MSHEGNTADALATASSQPATCACCGSPYGSLKLCSDCGKYFNFYHHLPHRMQEHGYKPQHDEWWKWKSWLYEVEYERDRHR